MNDTTRRYPRTLEEAFGPHTGRQIEEAQEPMHPHDLIVLWGSFFAAVALVVVLINPQGVLA